MAIKICLDAGHYARYNRSFVVPEYWESEMTWKLHLLLKDELEKRGFEVKTTRPDQRIDLNVTERGKMAKGCDLFMSLHSDAAYDSDDPEEKKSANEPVDRVTVFHPLDGRAADLSRLLADRIAEVMEVKQGGHIKTREGSYGNNYYGVINGAYQVGVPGLLIEHSFHTNARSAKWLLDNDNLERLAIAEADVLAEYYGMGGGTANLTPIEGRAVATDYQMEQYLLSVNPDAPQSVLDMIPLYISEGTVEGIRGDIAFAQSCLETGNFGFEGSAVTLEMNNFCGMGVTLGRPGNSFDTPQHGIRAQIQHLKAYANDKELAGAVIDPRFDKVARGSAPYVEWLGIQENPQGKGWASGEGYGAKILKILGKILKTPGKPYVLGERTLRRGDEGGDVVELQLLIQIAGYYVGDYGPSQDGADGVYGALTEKAVEAFQTAHGLTADGVYGPATHKRLLEVAAAIEDKPDDEPAKPQAPAYTHVLIIPGNEETLVGAQEEYGGEIVRLGGGDTIDE